MKLSELKEDEYSFAESKGKGETLSLSKLSQDDIKFEIQDSDNDSFIDSTVKNVIKAGEIYDSYTGAPVRAGIMSAVEGKNPLTAAYDQLGSDSSTAPTGKDIAKKLGVSTDSLNKGVNSYTNYKDGITIPLSDDDAPSPAGVVGLGIDVIADPTILIPASAGIKAVSKVAKPVVNTVSKGVKKAFPKIGQALTGVPVKNIEVYSKYTDEIDDFIKRNEGDIMSMSDDLRSKFNQDIKNTRMSLGNEIKESLESMPDSPAIDVSWVRKQFDEYKKRLNPTLKKDARAEIDEFSRLVDEMSTDGKITVVELNDLKEYLQEQAKSSYMKNGQIFIRSKDSSRAAKQAAATVRKQLNQISPEIANANNSLARLHSLEDTMNKNMLAEGKPFSALVAAGSGANKRNAKQLKELGEITGTDMLGDAEKLSAANTFANPPILPMDTTGKSFTRLALGYALGGVKGAVLTSPLTLKAAIKSKQIAGSVIDYFSGPGGSKAVDEVYKSMTSEQGKKTLEEIGRAARIASIHSTSNLAKSDENPDYIAKVKGKDKWAFDGYLKLKKNSNLKLINDEKFLEKVFSTDKGRKLLIKASSLKSNSKELKNIVAQIDKEFGGSN